MAVECTSTLGRASHGSPTDAWIIGVGGPIMDIEMRRTATRRIVTTTWCMVAIGQSLACSSDRTPDLPQRALGTLNRAIFVEGGTFLAGSDDWRDPVPAGSPYSKGGEDPHLWTVEGFWIQEHEVTNEEFVRFDPTHSFPVGRERHPVVDVTWRDAMSYAVSLGGSLPNEVQWEFAARGSARREYPWGQDEPSCERAHSRECDPRQSIEVMTRPDGATPEGVHDLAGNVREWVTPVWFDLERHPVNHDAIKMKGGSFAHPAFFLRSASVSNDFRADYKWDNVGFRVAWP
jgi:formylglycine-generating enzyme required for sulfatase activity